MAEKNWETLEGACYYCKKCRLWETRNHVVIGKGNKNADIIFKTLAKIIKEEREKQGKSQRLLADECSFQRSLLSRLENGLNEPKLVSIWTIAEALRMKPSNLIRLVENELPKDFSLIEKDLCY